LFKTFINFRFNVWPSYPNSWISISSVNSLFSFPAPNRFMPKNRSNRKLQSCKSGSRNWNWKWAY